VSQTRAPVRAKPMRDSKGYRRPVSRDFLTLGDPRKRGIALIVITGLVLGAFAVRLVELQAVKGEALAGQALDQRLRTVKLPALRGSIFDANGAILAATVESRDVTADQTIIIDPRAVGARLAPILGMDADDLAVRLTGDRRFVIVKKGITPETWRRIEDLGIPGIIGVPSSRRIYPADDLAANVVGFVGAEGAGLEGIEYAFDTQLSGVEGTTTYERGSGGNAIPTGEQTRVDATAGVDIGLTIDRDIQYVAQQVISEKVRKSQSDSGTVVVMDPRTGHILALATEPTFDANDASSAPADQRGNRALRDAYEPGSTSKVMTLAAVINEGASNINATFEIPGTLERGGKVFRDHDSNGTEVLTLTGIMAKSSNIGAIMASERIGGRVLLSYLKKFGIGEKTGLNFPGEGSGSVPPFSEWSPTTFPTIAFGQGLSLNSVQAASIFATIANDGLRIEPTLVQSITNPDGSRVPIPAPKTTRVVSPGTAAQIRLMLEAVVGEGGTAPKARIRGYRVGGKTGTAQMFDPVNGGYGDGVVASFIGMAPLDDPQLVVAVALVNPKKGRYGGQLAGPVFKRVMTYALQARHIPPTGTKPPNLPLVVGTKQ
jgi:cell division protein FtsI (penicillin-binding protein 3)